MSKNEIVEAEFQEVEAPEAPVEYTEVQEEAPPRTEVRIGMKENGDIYLNLSGTDQNLIIVDGLLDYAKREMNKVWENKLGTFGQ